MDAAKIDGFKPKMANQKQEKREATEEYAEKNGQVKKGSGASRCCQADNCTADLSGERSYHRRHKVCEDHAKAQAVLVCGIRQRFCQQCSRFGRFHELAEFDDAKRSCRQRLAGHNERRRKNCESQSEGWSCKGSGKQLKDKTREQSDDRGRIQNSTQDNATYKHFQMR